MNEQYVGVSIQRVITTETFLEGAADHTDGLAGYVEDFLARWGGTNNERGRGWTVESCADALKIPSGTLHRWLHLDKPAPVSNQKPAAQKVARSHAKAALRDSETRKAVLKSMTPDERDELRADVIALDLPKQRKSCRHCPDHCPEGGS